MTRETFFTPANLLTLSRLPMAALVWLRPLDLWFVLGLMALAGLSDVLDGRLERRRRARLGMSDDDPEASVGVWLDPLCDKIFVLSVVVAIAVAHPMPLWFLPLIALREILQTIAAVAVRAIPTLRKRVRIKFRANILGKVSTVAQFCAIAAILLRHPAQIPLVVLTAVLGAVAAAIYIGRSFDRAGS